MIRPGALAFVLALAIASVPAAAQRQPLPPPETAAIEAAQLPKEARATIALIRKGGPFPYAKDGAVFGNREGQLPRQAHGHYKEYTVKTPGERTRGARRIITGATGELYYTDDHYNHFRRIRE